MNLIFSNYFQNIPIIVKFITRLFQNNHENIRHISTKTVFEHSAYEFGGVRHDIHHSGSH